MNPSQMSDLRIVSLTTDKPSYTAYSDMTITGIIENRGTNMIRALIIAGIEDAQSNTIAVISPSMPLIDFAPLSSKDVSLTWNTGRFAPGDYKVIL